MWNLDQLRIFGFLICKINSLGFRFRSITLSIGSKRHVCLRLGHYVILWYGVMDVLSVCRKMMGNYLPTWIFALVICSWNLGLNDHMIAMLAFYFFIFLIFK